MIIIIKIKILKYYKYYIFLKNNIINYFIHIKILNIMIRLYNSLRQLFV